MMDAAENKDIFLSCFKCGRIVRSSDNECPRCGLQFGPGTLFECPFCSGLIWRNATKCASCGIDLTEFSESVLKTSAGFDMDNFVDGIINSELELLKSTIRRVACPGCGLMIRGDEDRCPRCDLPLEEAKVDCPVCGEKISISATSCGSCKAIFEELPEERPTEETPEPVEPEVGTAPESEPLREQVPARRAARKKPPLRKPASKRPVRKVTAAQTKKKPLSRKPAAKKVGQAKKPVRPSKVKKRGR